MNVFLTLGFWTAAWGMAWAQETTTIRGRVTDEHGAPVSFARVSTENSGAETREDGYYRFSTPRTDSLRLRVDALDYEPFAVVLPFPQENEFVYDVKIFSNAVTLGVVTVTEKFRERVEEAVLSIETLGTKKVDLMSNSTIVAALEQMPGMTFTNQQPSIRGSSGYTFQAGSRVLTLLNGLPMISPELGAVNFDLLPADNVKQIEVLKGASSVIYGAGAMGGIINVLTEEPTEEPKTVVRTRAKAFDAPPNRLSDFDGRSSAYELSTHVFHGRRIGQNFDFSTQFDAIHNSGYRKDEFTKRMRALVMTKYRVATVPGLSFGLNAQANIDSGATFIGFKDYPVHALSAGDGLISKFLLSRFTFDPTIQYVGKRVSHLYQGRAFLSRNEISTGQSGNYLMLYNEYQFKWNLWRDRIQTVSGASLTNNYANAGGTFNGRGKQLGVYSQIKFKPAPRWTLVAGVRYQYEDVYNVDTVLNVEFREGVSVPIRRTLRNLSPGITTVYGDSTVFVLPPYRRTTMNEPIFRGGVNYRLGRATYLRASAGQALRSPSVGERFTNTLAGPLQVLPNPFIEVERGWTAEVGGRQLYRTNNEKLAGYFDLAVFHMEFNRMVEFWADVEYILNNASLSSPNIAFKAQNISNVSITGVELVMQHDFKITREFGLAFGGGFTFIHPVDREGQKSWDGDDSTDVLVEKVVPVLLGAGDRSVLGFQDRPYTLKYRSKLLGRFNVELFYQQFSFAVNYRYTSPIVNVDKYLLIDLYEHMPTLKKAFGAMVGLPADVALSLPDEFVKDYLAANGIPRLFPDTRAYRRANPQGWHEFDFVLSYRSPVGTLSFHVFNALNTEFMTLPGSMGAHRSFAVQYKIEF